MGWSWQVQGEHGQAVLIHLHTFSPHQPFRLQCHSLDSGPEGLKIPIVGKKITSKAVFVTLSCNILCIYDEFTSFFFDFDSAGRARQILRATFIAELVAEIPDSFLAIGK